MPDPTGASRAQAREEVVEAMVAAVRKTLDDFADVFGLLVDTDAFARQIVSDSLADFDTLAGLLGYVKADTRWAVRKVGDTSPIRGWHTIEKYARNELDWSRRTTDDEWELVKSPIGPWEVVADAVTQ